MAAVIMFAGLVLSIAFNYITLKMWHVIQMPLYLFFPGGSLIIAGVIWVFLPMVISVFESDWVTHAKWEGCLQLVPKSRKRVLSKKLKNDVSICYVELYDFGTFVETGGFLVLSLTREHTEVSNELRVDTCTKMTTIHDLLNKLKEFPCKIHFSSRCDDICDERMTIGLPKRERSAAERSEFELSEDYLETTTLLCGRPDRSAADLSLFGNPMVSTLNSLDTSTSPKEYVEYLFL
ncbi:hypothetical protein Fcan01_10159 [Folsomia candida]|uniref:Uncharacterized protein n=1 Tax=Folsomia candida TaxID=158441 RepID=A0A226E8R5_FOLCA|nr:hypothetical protein Fcan01_10159 [Folsomia candida]